MTTLLPFDLKNGCRYNTTFYPEVLLKFSIWFKICSLLFSSGWDSQPRSHAAFCYDFSFFSHPKLFLCHSFLFHIFNLLHSIEWPSPWCFWWLLTTRLVFTSLARGVLKIGSWRSTPLATLLTILKQAMSPSVSEWMNEMLHIYIGISFSHKEEGSPAFFSNMDGSWGHCAGWHKSGERHFVWYPLYVKSKK